MEEAKKFMKKLNNKIIESLKKGRNFHLQQAEEISKRIGDIKK
tara:strand:- start:361 stop:489 length:129 start_codon:yes stop_codon:yes gene_type:complete